MDVVLGYTHDAIDGKCALGFTQYGRYLGRRAGDHVLATASDKDDFTILEPERSNSNPHNAHGNCTVTYIHQGYRFTVT